MAYDTVTIAIFLTIALSALICEPIYDDEDLCYLDM